MEYWRRHKECPICKSNRYFRMNDNAPKRKGFRILAFDQASITSGWSAFDDGELIKFGSWTSEGSNSTDRISKTKHWFANMLQTWKPDLVVLEDIQLQKRKDLNGNQTNEDAVITYKKLAHLQGVLQDFCYDNGYIFKVVPVQTWRSFNKIKGVYRTDQKKNAQLLIKSLYDVNVTQDEADAILIGRWAAHDTRTNEIVMF